MKEIQVYKEMPDVWVSECKKHNSFFHSKDWSDILSAAFNVKSVYIWDSYEKTGTVVHLFKVGIFKIGYISFPVSGMIDGNAITTELLQSFKDSKLDIKIHVLRVNYSEFDNYPVPSVSGVRIKLPETRINNLGSWSFDNLYKSLRGDLKKAERSGVIINKEPTASHAEEIYDMYTDTVKRNHGFVRYNKKYFNELIRVNHTSDNIWCYVALLDGIVIGFIVFLLHHDSGYYLHGGIKQEYKKYCPSSFLLYEGVKMAQQKGMQSFNLMTSPASQESLVKYKEKWGAETRYNTSISMNISPAAGLMFNSAEKIYQFIRKCV